MARRGTDGARAACATQVCGAGRMWERSGTSSEVESGDKRGASSVKDGGYRKGYVLMVPLVPMVRAGFLG